MEKETSGNLKRKGKKQMADLFYDYQFSVFRAVAIGRNLTFTPQRFKRCTMKHLS